MTTILSNGPSKDFVIASFQRYARGSKEAFLASPYFSYPDPVLEALEAKCLINLLVCLNSSTHPDALSKIAGRPRVNLRYFTGRFHAKIYIFDDAAMLGSANLTQAGFAGNREAVACFDAANEGDAIDDLRRLFTELWDSADVLTPVILSLFKQAWHTVGTAPNIDRAITDAVGRVEPPSINVQKPKQAAGRLFLQGLRRKIYEQYGPAFDEVGRVLAEENLERDQLLTELARPFHTNRFLNWVRLTHAPGESSWQEAPVRDEGARRSEIIRLGQEWKLTSDDRVPADYTDRLHAVERVFADAGHVADASRDDLISGIMGLHAFSEQLRFVKGGLKALPGEFWRQNGNDQRKVAATLSHLLFDADDFAVRLHDIVYDHRWKLSLFGLFCATELAGTVRPDICPPVNGRSAKAMRFIGFDVPGQ